MCVMMTSFNHSPGVFVIALLSSEGREGGEASRWDRKVKQGLLGEPEREGWEGRTMMVMLCPAQKGNSPLPAVCASAGCSSTWFTCGTTRAPGKMSARCLTAQLLTPIARMWPARYRSSIACLPGRVRTRVFVARVSE